jgi:magnesium-transporting ATPase (P-type)
MLEPGTAYSDMVILQGDHVTVDESALTGEGTPMTKKAIDSSNDHEKYSSKRHHVTTISAGTQILEVDDSKVPLALVLTTGSFTTKGELLTDVFSHRRKTFLFDEEGHVVFLILLTQAAIMISLVFHWLGDQLVFAWFYGMERTERLCPTC